MRIEAENRRLFKLKSKAIQKNLPRPKIINKKMFSGEKNAIKRMINEEFIALL